MIYGTDKKTARRRLMRYMAGLVLAVLEREDSDMTVRALEGPVADAFDAHGLRLARKAKCPTATAAVARNLTTVCKDLFAAGLLALTPNVRAPRYALGAHRVTVSHTQAEFDLGVGRSSVRRWAKAGMVERRDGGRDVVLWQPVGSDGAQAGIFFPARPALPKQGDLPLAEPAQGAQGAQEAKPAPAAPPWTVTTCETACFEVDGVQVIAERGGERPRVGYDDNDDGFCMVDADPAAVLRYARTLEAAALWALGGEA